MHGEAANGQRVLREVAEIELLQPDQVVSDPVLLSSVVEIQQLLDRTSVDHAEVEPSVTRS